DARNDVDTLERWCDEIRRSVSQQLEHRIRVALVYHNNYGHVCRSFSQRIKELCRPGEKIRPHGQKHDRRRKLQDCFRGLIEGSSFMRSIDRFDQYFEV